MEVLRVGLEKIAQKVEQDPWTLKNGSNEKEKGG